MQPPDEGLPDRPTLHLDDHHQEPSKPRFLFPVDGDGADAILPLVCDLVAAADGELLIGSPVILPDQTPLDAPEPREEAEWVAAKYVLEAKQQFPESPPINQVVTAGHDWDSIINAMIEKYHVTTLVTPEHTHAGIRYLLGFDGFDELWVPETCDTVIPSRVEHTEAINTVLVPIARGPHSEFAIETGLALARQNGASLELLHVYQTGDEEGRAMGEEILARGTDLLDGFEPAEQTLLEADEIHEAIIEYTQPFDVIVFGAPREGLLRQFMLGTFPEDVSEEADGTVLIAHKGGTNGSWLDKLV